MSKRSVSVLYFDRLSMVSQSNHRLFRQAPSPSRINFAESSNDSESILAALTGRPSLQRTTIGEDGVAALKEVAHRLRSENLPSRS
jgi:hypothetical protein